MLERVGGSRRPGGDAELAVDGEPVGEVPGPDGNELSLDVARKGPEDARKLLVVSSGTHGVEGYFGVSLKLSYDPVVVPETCRTWAAGANPSFRPALRARRHHSTSSQ